MSQSDTSRATQTKRDALTIIRSATAACHVSLEKEIDWPTALGSPAGYVALLRTFLRVVEPLECRMELFEPTTHAESAHNRTAQLRSDIAAVLQDFAGGGEVDRVDDFVVDVSFIVDRVTALGALYVLEGSALGGQILSKQVRDSAATWSKVETLGLLQPRSLPCLDSYFVGRGGETGRHWRNFCGRLNDALPNEQTASTAARAAVQTFELFHSSLTGKRVCVRT